MEDGYTNGGFFCDCEHHSFSLQEEGSPHISEHALLPSLHSASLPSSPSSLSSSSTTAPDVKPYSPKLSASSSPETVFRYIHVPDCKRAALSKALLDVHAFYLFTQDHPMHLTLHLPGLNSFERLSVHHLAWKLGTCQDR
jgi:hypothetical protein